MNNNLSCIVYMRLAGFLIRSDLPSMSVLKPVFAFKMFYLLFQAMMCYLYWVKSQQPCFKANCYKPLDLKPEQKSSIVSLVNNISDLNQPIISCLEYYYHDHELLKHTISSMASWSIQQLSKLLTKQFELWAIIYLKYYSLQ